MAIGFNNVPPAPADPVLGINTAFNNCASADKVNLGVGAYRNDAGQPVVFQAVIEAEEALLKGLHDKSVNKEYLPSSGHGKFLTYAKKMLLGGDATRFGSIQTLGGTGAVKIGLEFAKVSILGYDLDYPKLAPKIDMKQHTVWVSRPTWPNHINIANDTGFTTSEYRYFNDETLTVDESGMVSDLTQNVKANDVVLLHAIGHNPTGADPSPTTMMKVYELIQARGAICMLDIAYQGFVSGSLEADLINVENAIKHYPQMPLIIAQSFSKNMGFYGERLGAVHIGTGDALQAEAVVSQLNLLARRTYSNPARHPADLAAIVLSESYESWSNELKEVAGRILKMRSELKRLLDQHCPTSNWEHIVTQKGMFAYTGLIPREVQKLRDEHAIFMAGSGRISMAGLNSGNIEKVATAIAAVRKESAKL